MMAVGGPQFSQSQMMSVFSRTPVSTTDAAQKFTRTTTTQSDILARVPDLGNKIDIRA